MLLEIIFYYTLLLAVRERFEYLLCDVPLYAVNMFYYHWLRKEAAETQLAPVLGELKSETLKHSLLQ